MATRTTAPPKLDDKQMAAFLEKAKTLAPKYHTELLKQASVLLIGNGAQLCLAVFYKWRKTDKVRGGFPPRKLGA